MNGARLLTQWENRVRREAKAEGKAEGMLEGEARGKEGLRTAVVTICEVLGIAISPTRQTQLEAMGVDELEALCRALPARRRWPRRGER
jgi:predicted transposase YdaD